jgi:hypothetical protein
VSVCRLVQEIQAFWGAVNGTPVRVVFFWSYELYTGLTDLHLAAEFSVSVCRLFQEIQAFEGAFNGTPLRVALFWSYKLSTRLTDLY